MNTKENVDQGFDYLAKSMEQFWSICLMSMNGFTWSQEQFENILHKYLERNKDKREEFLKMSEGLFLQLKKNQMEFQDLIKESVTDALETTNNNYSNYFADLNKKIEDITNKL